MSALFSSPGFPLGSAFFKAGQLIGANMNSTADQAIPITLPAGVTKWRIQIGVVSNPSTSLTTCQGTVYTAASKGGIALGATTQSYSALTNSTINTAGNCINLALANSIVVLNVTTLYLSLTIAQGGAATADFTIYGFGMP